jgi:hypothetical protein
LTRGVDKCNFFKFYTSRDFGHLILVFFIHFFWILEPHSKFKWPKSIFSEIPLVQPLIPIIACRSAKIATRHLRGVPYLIYYIVFGPWDLVKVKKKSVPEKSTYGAASHLKKLWGTKVMYCAYSKITSSRPSAGTWKFRIGSICFSSLCVRPAGLIGYLRILQLFVCALLPQMKKGQKQFLSQSQSDTRCSM